VSSLKSVDTRGMPDAETQIAVATVNAEASLATDSATRQVKVPERAPQGEAHSPQGQGRLLVTREHKLALIIGFAILLVVGVLVGDHFSKARHSVIGTDVATAPTNVIGLPVDALPAANAPGATAPVEIASETPREGAPAAANTATATPAEPASVPAPRSTTTISMTPNQPTEPAPQSGSVPNAPAPTPSPDRGPLVFLPVNPEPATTIVNTPLPGGEGTRPANGGGAGTIVTPARVEPAALRISTGKLLAHPVAKGETLVGIARKYYADSKYATQLAEYNKSRLGSKMTLREGVTLRIPPRDVLLGLARLGDDAIVAPGRAAPGGNPVAPRASEKPPETTTASSTREYVVVKGDTLGSIAQRLLGSVKRAREITAMNKDVIRDEANLRVGAKLKIPAR